MKRTVFVVEVKVGPDMPWQCTETVPTLKEANTHKNRWKRMYGKARVVETTTITRVVSR